MKPLLELPPELLPPKPGAAVFGAYSRERPPRKMPTLWAVARYWAGHPEVFGEIDLDAPDCFRCAIVVALDETKTQRELWQEASHYLQRAHLHDRYRGGLDGPQNIVPLCVPCHRVMPTFDDADSAIRWCWSVWLHDDWETRPVPSRCPRVIPGAETRGPEDPPPVAEGRPLVAATPEQGTLF